MPYIINLQAQFLPSRDKLPHLLNRHLETTPSVSSNFHQTLMPAAAHQQDWNPTDLLQCPEHTVRQQGYPMPCHQGLQAAPNRRQTGRSIPQMRPCASHHVLLLHHRWGLAHYTNANQMPHFNKQIPRLGIATWKSVQRFPDLLDSGTPFLWRSRSLESLRIHSGGWVQ